MASGQETGKAYHWYSNMQRVNAHGQQTQHMKHSFIAGPIDSYGTTVHKSLRGEWCTMHLTEDHIYPLGGGRNKHS